MIKKNFNLLIQIIKRYTLINLSKYVYIKELVIGAGAYGALYFWFSKTNFSLIIIKSIEKEKVKERVVDIKAGTIQKLQDILIFPEIYDFIRNKRLYFCLKESLQGTDLNKFL